MRILFVTWDAPEASYLESLFLPIFEQLGSHGMHFGVLQFTWGSRSRVQAQAKACAARDIPYWSASVWRGGGPLGPFLSAMAGARKVRAVARKFGADMLMPRGLMPSLAVLVGGRGLPVVFDADGLPADERVDFSGTNPAGLTYRLMRDIEAQMARRAAAVMVRTPLAVQIIKARVGAGWTSPVLIVSNGRDPEVYRPFTNTERLAARRELGIAPNTPLVTYVGSLGPKYCLPQMLRLFQIVSARRPDAVLLMLTGNYREAEAALRAFDPMMAAKVIIRSVPPPDVPRFVAAADVGLAFPATTFSTQTVVAIKMGEYLLCGLPVIGTAPGGDLASVFADQGGGDVGEMHEEALDRAASWFLQEVLPNREEYRRRAREVGELRFSLDAAVQRYLAALRVVELAP